MSLFGPSTAVKALWAAVASSEKEKLRLVDDTYIHRDDSKYHTISTALDKANIHLLYVNGDATNQIQGLNQTQFVIVNEAPKELFYPKLNRRCTVPMMKSWEKYLWDKGLEDQIISPLSGFGMPGYLISTDQDSWQRIIKKGIVGGEIESKGGPEWQD